MGTALKDSKSIPGSKVLDADLQQCVQYYFFVQSKILQHGGTSAQIVAWAIDRDRETRKAARQLTSEGWPLGDALQHATETKVAILWTCGQIGVAAQALPC